MMNNLMKICGVLSLIALFPLMAVAENQNRTAINPKHLSDTTVYGYSQANVVKANSVMVYAAGQVGVSPEGPNDFQSQVDRSFDSLLAVLKASGASAEDVVKITLLIVDHNPEKLAYLGKKRRAVFGDQPPASTLIPVTRLYTDGVLFEIDATAVLK
jgi:enamine deaminase RidA (YjgF/YER057c/UK114 family)